MSDKKTKVVRLSEAKIVDIIDKLATEEVNKRLAEAKKASDAALIENEIKTLQAKLGKLNETTEVAK